MKPEELKPDGLEVSTTRDGRQSRGRAADGLDVLTQQGQAGQRGEENGLEAQGQEAAVSYVAAPGGDRPRTLRPGATIGVLGGGQLGRMMALAGSAMGYRFVALDPAPDAPCGQVTPQIHAAYNDRDAARELARRSDVITYEFENVDAGVAALLTAESYVPQGSALLYTTQHRLREKAAIEAAGVPVAPYRKVGSLAELNTAAADLGLPCVLKTATGGMTARDKPSSAGRKSWKQPSGRSRRELAERRRRRKLAEQTASPIPQPQPETLCRSWCWRNSLLLAAKSPSLLPAAHPVRSRAFRLPRTFM